MDEKKLREYWSRAAEADPNIRPFAPEDFSQGVMNEELTFLKGKAYVFLTDQAEALKMDQRWKVMEADRGCQGLTEADGNRWV